MFKIVEVCKPTVACNPPTATILETPESVQALGSSLNKYSSSGDTVYRVHHEPPGGPIVAYDLDHLARIGQEALNIQFQGGAG